MLNNIVDNSPGLLPTRFACVDNIIKLCYCKNTEVIFQVHFKNKWLTSTESSWKKLDTYIHIRNLNGHLDFSGGFQVIDPSNDEKNAKIEKKTPGTSIKICFQRLITQ